MLSWVRGRRVPFDRDNIHVYIQDHYMKTLVHNVFVTLYCTNCREMIPPLPLEPPIALVEH